MKLIFLAVTFVALLSYSESDPVTDLGKTLSKPLGLVCATASTLNFPQTPASDVVTVIMNVLQCLGQLVGLDLVSTLTSCATGVDATSDPNKVIFQVLQEVCQGSALSTNALGCLTKAGQSATGLVANPNPLVLLGCTTSLLKLVPNLPGVPTLPGGLLG